MKLFKMNSIFYSLLTMVMLTVFLSSCEKEDMSQDVNTVVTNDFEKMSLKEKQAYLKTSSIESLIELGYVQLSNEISLRGSSLCDHCDTWITYHTETGFCWTTLYKARVCGMDPHGWCIIVEMKSSTVPYC